MATTHGAKPGSETLGTRLLRSWGACASCTNSEKPQTKLPILHQAVSVISTICSKVVSKGALPSPPLPLLASFLEPTSLP